MDNIDIIQDNIDNHDGNVEESFSLYQLLIHTSTHSQDEVILNRNVFPHIDPGDYIQIIDPDRPNDRLILRAPNRQNAVGRLEISLAKSIAEPLNFKAFSRVVVEKIDIEDAKVDFVELAFRRQFLQRGNMWRFKQATFGCPVYEGQNIALDGIQAQIQELGNNGCRKLSGIITNKTHFTFRSRSARIIWLLQVSAEMWEYDRNGDLYFEKFLHKFVDPLFDRWKALGVSHSLTVIFFARTMFTDSSRTCKHQDHFKIVIENAAEIDKTSQLKALKKEFWAFPKSLGWNVPSSSSSSTTVGDNGSIAAVPSDAASGNCLEALNTTLNLLDKHYMDRDLQRTGNSIVMISAGTGVFKIKPSMALITKQRMMDSGIGLDFVSLSQPPLHAVPLFEVDCSDMEGFDENSRSGLHFYETPHWINVSYLDYEKDYNATLLKPTVEKVVKLDLPQRDFNWSGLFDHQMSDLSQSSNDKLGKAFMPLPFTSTIEGFVRLRMNGERDRNIAYSCLLPAILNSLIKEDYKTYDDDDDDVTVVSNINNSSNNNLQWGGISFQSLKKYQRSNSNWQLSVSTFYSDEMKGREKQCKPGTEVESSSEQWYKASHTSSLNNSDTNSISRFSTMKRFVQSGTLFKDKADLGMSINSNGLTPPQAQIAESRESDNSYSEKVISLLGSNSRVRRSRNRTGNSSNLFNDPIFQLSFGNFNSLSSSSSSGSSKALMDNFDNNVFNIMKSNRCTNSRRVKGSPLRKSKLNNSSLMLASSLPDKASWAEESTRHMTPPTQNKAPLEDYQDYSNNSSFDEKSITQRIRSPSKGSINYYRNRPLRSESNDDDNLNSKTSESLTFTSLLGNQSKRLNRSSNILSIPSSRLKPSENNNSISVSQRVRVLDEDQRYIIKNRVNPFLKEEGALFLKYRTHNRSRWSHVFPSIKHESEIRIAHYGLNWKSLSQPAILPLTTDYLASVNTLKEEYHIQGDYELIIDSNTCAFDTAKSLLTEMICQRLSQEYQLVDLEGNDDPFSAYKNYIVTNYNESSFSKKKQIASSKNDEDKDLFYILTMGHRIQFLFYNPSLRKVRVIRLLWAGPKTKPKDLHSPNPNSNQMEITNQTAEYSYLLWVPQLNKYQLMKQKFNQFPSPEYGWSNADEILLGNSELDMNNDTVKAKRLRFVMLPEITDTEDDLERYYAKMDKLMQHLSKYKQSNELMVELTKDRTLGKTTKGKDKKYDSKHHVIKIWLQGPHHCNPKWCFLKYDTNLSISRAFHIEFHWLSCDSWLMDEYVNILFRRCSSWSLRIAQIPEFFCTATLNIHPFRAQPFVNVPSAISSYYGSSTENIPWVSVVTLIEALYFKEKSQGWIEDEERYTSWETVNEEVQINTNKGTQEVVNNEKPDTLKDMLAGNRNKDRNKNLSWLFARRTTQKREKSNQYIHRLGFACVRVSSSGFVWLLNSAGRVSDISSTKDMTKKVKDNTNEEKEEKVNDGLDDETTTPSVTANPASTTSISTINRNTALRKFQELRIFCESVAICYGIFIDIVEEAMTSSE